MIWPPGQKLSNFFVAILVQTIFSKRRFEINWPLGIGSYVNGTNSEWKWFRMKSMKNGHLSNDYLTWAGWRSEHSVSVYESNLWNYCAFYGTNKWDQKSISFLTSCLSYTYFSSHTTVDSLIFLLFWLFMLLSMLIISIFIIIIEKSLIFDIYCTA